MSAIHERQWALEREREIRAIAHRNRMAQISDMTESYLRRYENLLNDLVAEGLDQYIPTEFAHVRSEIYRIRNMDPWEAREVSRVLGNFVYSLPRQARQQRDIAEEHQRLLREEAEREKRLQQEKLQAEKEDVWFKLTSNWENKLARNLAFKQLTALKQQAFRENWKEVQISEAIQQIKQVAEAKATEQQKSFIQTVKDEMVQEQKVELIKSIESSNLPISHSQRLKQQIENVKNEENLTVLVQEIATIQDEIIESEEVRKEMVKAVYQSLKQAGFNVLNPVKQTTEEGEDIVLVQAARPSGNQAKFRISLNGSVRYEFDNYKGQRCKEDIQQVLPKLQEIYGVNLSNERVIWENPDDKLMDAKPIAPIHTRSVN